MTAQEILFAIMLFSGGILAGFLSGLLGIGGGVVYVPLLMFAASLSIVPSLSSMHVIIATSLFAGTFTSSVSFFHHFEEKNVDFRSAVFLTSGALIAAIVTPRLMLDIDSEKLKIFIAVIVGIIGLFMFFEDRLPKDLALSFPKWSLFLAGLIIGSVAVSSGLGGGVFFTPVLLYLYSFNIKKAIGTSTMAVATAMFSSAVVFMFFDGTVDGRFQIGYVNYFAGISLALGGMIGPRYGVRLLKNVSVPFIRKVFSIFLILYSLKIIGI